MSSTCVCGGKVCVVMKCLSFCYVSGPLWGISKTEKRGWIGLHHAHTHTSPFTHAQNAHTTPHPFTHINIPTHTTHMHTPHPSHTYKYTTHLHTQHTCTHLTLHTYKHTHTSNHIIPYTTVGSHSNPGYVRYVIQLPLKLTPMKSCCLFVIWEHGNRKQIYWAQIQGGCEASYIASCVIPPPNVRESLELVRIVYVTMDMM